VNLRRALICTMLIYVALDLSLPAMPGAFVFEPGDSVESIQSNRGRESGKVAVPPARVLNEPVVLARPRPDATAHPAPPRPVAPRARSVVNHLPRAPFDLAPPTEDPH
jgi:hypothetical protein